jgi:hypothetical protein
VIRIRWHDWPCKNISTHARSFGSRNSRPSMKLLTRTLSAMNLANPPMLAKGQSLY